MTLKMAGQAFEFAFTVLILVFAWQPLPPKKVIAKHK
jgi:hypothetical protein